MQPISAIPAASSLKELSSAMEDIPEVEHKRREAVWELFKSEVIFLDGVETCECSCDLYLGWNKSLDSQGRIILLIVIGF